MKSHVCIRQTWLFYYKVGGATPAETLKGLLLPGEIEDLSREVEKLSGYRSVTIEEIKNG